MITNKQEKKKMSDDDLKILIKKVGRSLDKHNGYLDPWDLDEDGFSSGEIFMLRQYINIFNEFRKRIIFEEE
jgi:hypothetical protein